LENAIINVRNS